MKKSYKVEVVNGEVIILDPNFLADLEAIDNPKLSLMMSTMTRDRSQNQNAYYWGVIIRMIAEDTGGDEDKVHAFLKAEFGQMEQVTFVGKRDTLIKQIPISSTKYSTVEFEDYLAKCRMWAADFLGIIIPLPHESML